MGRKTDRIIITLECQEAEKAGATASRYTTQKNKRKTTGKLELRKYNPYMKKVTLHKEVKG